MCRAVLLFQYNPSYLIMGGGLTHRYVCFPFYVPFFSKRNFSEKKRRVFEYGGNQVACFPVCKKKNGLVMDPDVRFRPPWDI